MVRLLDIIFVPSAAASNIGTTASTTSSEDPTVLTPPIPPARLNREFVVSLKQGDPTGASIHISGPYLGFSIGLSVSDRVIGKNSSVLAVPFLNHIVNVANHAGAVRVRVGGNGTQISSWFVITRVLKSNRLRRNNPASGGTARRQDIDRITTGTHYYAASRVEFALDFVKMLGNLSSLVKTEFYLRLDFANTTDTSNQVAFAAMTEEVLGSNLHDISPGNELDFYDRPGYNKRPSPYTF
ncbi:Glycosyl hydrolase family 79 C-terminal beta domain, partial [Rhizoctonia solani]